MEAGNVMGIGQGNNRQWLESMSDEELACWLDAHIESCAACSHLTRKGCEIPNNGYDCLRGRLNWLRMEHKERKKNEHEH